MHHEQPPDRRRPFRFGVLGERIRSCEGLLAEARRAEALGYSTLLLRDHFVREPFGDQLAPMVAPAAAAGATRMLCGWGSTRSSWAGWCGRSTCGRVTASGRLRRCERPGRASSSRRSA
jgi:hypothetical protein